MPIALSTELSGLFADAVRGDFETMLTILRGEPRILYTDEDLEYRRLGELRIAQVGEAGDASLDAFAAEVGRTRSPNRFRCPTSPKGISRPTSASWCGCRRSAAGS